MLARLLSWLVPTRSAPAPAPAAIATEMPPEWRPQSGTRMDGPISNEWTGVGTIRSKLEATHPSAPLDLTDDELDWLGVSPLSRLIRQPVDQGITRGYRVDAADGQRDVTGAIDEAIGLKAVLADWLKTARGGRGAHILIVDGSKDWSQPIGRGIGVGGSGVLQLHVLDHREAVALDMDPDPASPGWGQPLHWHVTLRRDGVAQVVGKVHASRLVTHRGVRGLPAAVRSPLTPRGYGYSMWHLYWPAVRRVWAAAATGEAAGIELTSPWIRLGSLASFIGDKARAARDAITSFTRVRSSHGTSVLMPGDEIGRESLSLSGFSEITADGWTGVSGVEGYPAVKLTGQAPAGLSSDDEAANQTWSTLADAMSAEMERAGRQIHDVILGDGRRTWVWGAVRVPSDLDVAQAELIRAQRDETLIRAGAAAPAHSAGRYQGPEVLPDPVIPADWRGVPPQGVEGVTAAYVGAHEAGLISRETAVTGLAAVGVARASDIVEPVQPAPAAPAPAEAPPLVRVDADTYRVPEGARGNARQVLRWREEHGDAVQGMTEVGWRRARQLADSETVGRETVAAMAAFNRHRANAEVAAEYKDEPWRDAGHVAWLGWGGTTGIDWAREITGAAE